MNCPVCSAEMKFNQCERCDGRGGWDEYSEQTFENEWVECPDCNGDGGALICPQWARGQHPKEVK